MITSTRRRRILTPFFALILLALAACGGGTATAPAGQTTTTASGAATTAATVPAASSAASATSATSGGATRTAGTGGAATAGAATATGTAAVPATATRAGTGTPATTATRPAGSATAASGGTQRFVIAPDTSKATYTVQETFVGRGLATAVGTTSAITGEITIDRQNPSRSQIGTITVDISKLASDSGQRDNRIRSQWLESTKYPTATFVPKRLEGLPTTAYTEDQELTFKIVGDMTIRTVTKEVTFDAKGKIVGDVFSGTATTGFNMTDFGFDPPSIAGVLTSENAVALTITIEARRAQ